MVARVPNSDPSSLPPSSLLTAQPVPGFRFPQISHNAVVVSTGRGPPHYFAWVSFGKATLDECRSEYDKVD